MNIIVPIITSFRVDPPPAFPIPYMIENTKNPKIYIVIRYAAIITFLILACRRTAGCASNYLILLILVRVTGSAPMTFCSQNRRATRLRYTRKLQFTNSAKLSLFRELAWRDSNTQQPSYQDGILPVELQASYLSFTLGSVTSSQPPVKQKYGFILAGQPLHYQHKHEFSYHRKVKHLQKSFQQLCIVHFCP